MFPEVPLERLCLKDFYFPVLVLLKNFENCHNYHSKILVFSLVVYVDLFLPQYKAEKENSKEAKYRQKNQKRLLPISKKWVLKQEKFLLLVVPHFSGYSFFHYPEQLLHASVGENGRFRVR